MTISVRTKKSEISDTSYQAGTTLIEVLIYILLVSFIIGGSLLAVYQILEGSRSMSNKTMAEQEADFIARKIAWVLNGATTINSLTIVNPNEDTLSVTKSGSNLVVDLLDGRVRLSRDNGANFLPISGKQVIVSDLNFHFSRIGASSDSITASFFINGKEFQITRYVKF